MEISALPTRDPTSEQASFLDEVLGLYERGLYAQAYRCGTQRLGPLEEWPGVPGRVLAGRLANNLGATRWCQAWHARTCRLFPDLPELAYYRLLLTLHRRGPYYAWLESRTEPTNTELNERQRAEWLALRARILVGLRDVSAARADIEAALKLCPDHPWVLVDQHAVLSAMDEREAALDATAQALAIRPHYRPAVQQHAYQLVQLNRDDEAIELLTQAAEAIESGDLWAQLSALYSETRRHDVAERCVERALQWYLLIDRDKSTRRWLASRKWDFAYRRGDYDEAIRWAEQVDTPYYRAVVSSLRKAQEHPEGNYRYMLLDVEFVRQHHMTCAPATLTALSRFWGRPIDHVQLAGAICYDGTPAHKERHWAEGHGFTVREFRVTWENARALIERGIPFTLTTTGPNAAHLQPVIGFDERCGMLLVRDPSERHHFEYRAQELLDQSSASGPRGMALIPHAQAETLREISLDDAEHYDVYHQLQLALESHQRASAVERLEELRRLGPDHRLTLHAEATMAWYDHDRVRQLRAVEALAARYPGDSSQQLARLGLLSELGRKSDWFRQLRELCASQDAHPVYGRMLALELIQDHRTMQEAALWIRRVFRQRQAAQELQLQSRYLWRRGDRATAVETMRLAALAESYTEGFAAEYFSLARSTGQIERGLEFLRQRHDTLGRQSADPTFTLTWALDSLDRHREAAEVLDQGRQWRPDDGDALLNAAQFLVSWGRADDARELLRRAEPISNRARWLNVASRWAMSFDDLAAQEKLFREAVALQPLNTSLVTALYRTIGDRLGTEAALEFLESYLGKYPEHYDLRQTWIMEIRSEGLAQRWIPELERMLELHPDDPWTLREMALAYVDLHQSDQALPFAEQALMIDPNAAASWSIRGQALAKLGRRAEAADSFESAIRQSVDWEPAFDCWLQMCESREERLRVFNVAARELQSQVVTGDLLLSLPEQVLPTLDPDAALELFRSMHAARPDLFQTWLGLSQLLRLLGRGEEAQPLIDEATRRFPLLPRVWLDAAEFAQEQGDLPRQIECLRQALAINPRWPKAVYRLALALRHGQQSEAALELLQNGLSESPRDPVLRCGLAEILWQQKRGDEAVQAVSEVVRRCPDFTYAWDCLRDWVHKLGKPELVADTARQLAATRPNEIVSWRLLVDVLPTNDETWQERRDAVERALALNPQATEMLRRKAFLLAERGEFDAAIATCQTPIHGRPARSLQICELDLLGEYRSLQRAIERLKAILRDDPDSPNLWHRLAEWSEKAGDWEEYHHATEQMVRTAPDNAVSWGYRGDSLLRQEKTAEAIECFEKSIRRDPKYEFGADQLIGLYVVQKRFAEVRDVLARVGPFVSSGFLQLAELRLALHEGDRATAYERFESLVENADALPHQSTQALRYFQALGGLPHAQLLLERLLPSTANKDIGRLWAWSALLQDARNVKRALKKLRKLRPPSDAWHEACQLLLINFNSYKLVTPGMRLIQSRRRDLQRHDGSWCAAIEFLLDSWSATNVPRGKLRRWIKDWQKRDELTSYHWFQLVRTAACLEDWDLVSAMGSQALSDPRTAADENAELTRLFFALSLLQAGRWEEARLQIAQFRDFETTEYYTSLRRYLRRVDTALDTLLQRAADDTPAAARSHLDKLRSDLKLDAQIQSLARSPMKGRAFATVDIKLRQTAGVPVPVWVRFGAWLSRRLRGN